MSLNFIPNKISSYLNKPSEDFRKEDLIKFIQNNKIEMVNLRYVGGDGRLKTLNFYITSTSHLDNILSRGERVDGSSLFSYIDAESSDLYVIPRYKTAYLNPFSEIPAVDILCSFFSKDGTPLPSSPENILKKAHEVLKKETGFEMEAMAELEYYVFFERKNIYPVLNQKGYEESSPFVKFENLRIEAMKAIAETGGIIKYGHSEVGHIVDGEREMEQHEIEMSPVPIENAADQVVIAKWILRKIGYKYGVVVTFAPKISIGHAGSGLHIHTRLMKNEMNQLVGDNGLSDYAKKMISGFLGLSPSLTAFGNTVPISYLRLVSHQEAPTNICWGDRNRSVLVRVPLGWSGTDNMIKEANPQEEVDSSKKFIHQTVEFRCPDGSADIYLLLAGLAVATRYGLEMKDSLEIAKKLYVDKNIFSPEYKEILKTIPKLPSSCWESAQNLLKQREIYQKDGVFPNIVIDGLAKKLKSYNDKDLNKTLQNKSEEIKKLVEEYIYC